MRLYFKFIVLGTIIGTILSLIFPNSGFIIGGLIIGYLIADNYLDGAVNGFLSQALAGILVSLFIPLLMWIFLNITPYSQFPNSNAIFFGIILMGIISAVTGSIMGSVCGVLGVFINKITKKDRKTSFKEENSLEISWNKIAIIGIIGVLVLVAVVYAYTSANHTNNNPEEYIDNVSITNSSDGLWNVNFNTVTAANMDYFGVEIMWLDSSNQIIICELVCNQTHVVKGQVFNISQSFNLSETPSYVDILFYDNPYFINDINNAHMQYLFKYDNGTWINPNFQNNDKYARDLFKQDNGT